MRVGLMVFVLALATGLHGAGVPAAPAADVTAGGVIRVALDATLLRNAEVRKHLMSGLTANFVVSVSKREQYGRIEIRYEPWDEIFFASAISYDGRGERTVLRSIAELEKWWSAPRLLIGNGASSGQRVRMVVELIPFSASEEADAKKWIATSLGEANSASRVGEGGPGAVEATSLFSAVVGSSIRRKPVLRYSWDVVVRKAPK